MDRTIEQVPMNPALRAKLTSAGHGLINSFHMDKWEILAKELEVTEVEAKRLIGNVLSYGRSAIPSALQPVTAWDLLQKQLSGQQSIVTGSTKLNQLLGGGIPMGGIVELCGVPGIGKTQLCMQLCVNVQIPDKLNGVNGSAIFIDTDGGLVVERLQGIAQTLADQCKEEATRSHNSFDEQTALKLVNVDDILHGIFHFRCHDYFDLVTVVHLLPEFIAQKSNIKLIVIDSVATHFRYAFENMARRAKILNSFMQRLTCIAVQNNIAVVVTNQMTTRIASGEESRLVPALGATWGHACAVRLNLFWNNNTRIASLFKSPSRGEASVPFFILPAGIRDLVSADSFADGESEGDTSLLLSSQLPENSDDLILGRLEEVEMKD